MNTQGDDEVLAAVAQEAKGTRGAACVHGEDVGTVGFTPGIAAVGTLEGGLLDDAEECVGVGLEDLSGDGVSHCKTFWMLQDGE